MGVRERARKNNRQRQLHVTIIQWVCLPHARRVGRRHLRASARDTVEFPHVARHCTLLHATARVETVQPSCSRCGVAPRVPWSRHHYVRYWAD